MKSLTSKSFQKVNFYQPLLPLLVGRLFHFFSNSLVHAQEFKSLALPAVRIFGRRYNLTPSVTLIFINYAQKRGSFNTQKPEGFFILNPKFLVTIALLSPFIIILLWKKNSSS
jgi:hypothetical protein